MKTDNTLKHCSTLIIFELANRFFAAVALAYILGIIVGRFYLEQPVSALWWAGLMITIILGANYFRIFSFYKAVLLALAIVAGGTAFYYAAQPPAYGVASYAGVPVYLEGTVVEEPLVFDNHTAYRLKAEIIETAEGRFPVKGTLLLNIYSNEQEHYWFGERLRLRGTIGEARGQRNPGGFDHRFYLRSQGLDALIYTSPLQVSSLGMGETGWLAASAVKLRSSMVANIQSALPSPSAELLTAILFGQRHRLPDEVEENFRRAGAGHLMAVSGLHVGLIAAMILSFWKRLNLRGRLPLALAIILVFAYAYLTGMRPSALRAAVMVSMALGALLLDRENDLPTAISFAALLTLFLNPLLLFTAGFQLSYAATLVLVYTYRPLEKFLNAIRCPRFLQAPLAVTAAAQIGVLPLCIYYFHYIPTGALLFNLLLLPLIAFVVGLGLCGALVSLINYTGGVLLLWSARPLLEMMLVITGFSHSNFFYVAVNPPGALFLFSYYGLLFSALWLYYQWEKDSSSSKETGLINYLKKSLAAFCSARPSNLRICFGIFLVLVVVLVWFGIIFPSQEQLTVTFIDVGQGAAALIEAPCGVVILVDAGGRPAFHGDPGVVGERVVMPFLRRQGISSLDLAVITHPHEDHFGGFIPMVGNLPLVNVLISPIGGQSDYYEELLLSAEKAGSNITAVSAGQNIRCCPELLLEVIGPPERMYRGTNSDLNNNSLVFILHYGEIRMLFTGDIEDAAADDLLRRGVNIRSDLLLIPHHGGYMQAMPEFLEAVKPAIAVIQVGLNSFGHPHPYVIDALKEAAVTTYRNDLHGAVIIETDGRDIMLTTIE